MGISWSGVLVRILFANALVLLTFNPSGWSFYHWASAPPPGMTPEKALAGIALLIGWIICLRTAFVAFGWLGVILCAAFLGTFVWVLFDLHILQSMDSTVMVWISLVILGVILGIGLSWSLIRAKTTGQIETQ
ncbi:MAG TPA: DUF6524 family protein [Casimicrobiaceae bacterium]|nr:DUF6524 family protein [Casimicrobiaceae bacterium]